MADNRPPAPGGAGARRAAFGALQDGTEIEKVVLANGNGVSATVMTLGATLQSLVMPDRVGTFDDVVLGHDAAADYLGHAAYFGASIGRFANRIADGAFVLEGERYRLERNDGSNSLHGGTSGFDKRFWTIVSLAGGAEPSVTMAYRSADGEGGYPGTLDVTATYSLDADDVLTVRYEATTDRPTIVSLSQHTYWNLAGAAAAVGALDAVLTLDAASFTPVDDRLIPTGEIRAVAGTPFDFRRPTSIEARVRDGSDAQIRRGRGYDHNFVIDGTPGTMRRAARLADSRSGRALEVWATAPGMQFYSGNFLDGSVMGKRGRLYRAGDGVAFEPQHFPDAPNQPAFPSARLDPGETYRNVIAFHLSTLAD